MKFAFTVDESAETLSRPAKLFLIKKQTGPAERYPESVPIHISKKQKKISAVIYLARDA